MEAPQLFKDLTVFWGLVPLQQLDLWLALDQTHWTCPAGWKRALLAHDLAGDGLRAVLGDPRYAPCIILTVVEALVDDGRLSRVAAVPIEDQILDRVTAAGEWRGIPTVQVPLWDIPGFDLASTIGHYWR